MSVEVVLVVEGIHLDREESSKWSGVGKNGEKSEEMWAQGGKVRDSRKQ